MENEQATLSEIKGLERKLDSLEQLYQQRKASAKSAKDDYDEAVLELRSAIRGNNQLKLSITLDQKKPEKKE